MTTIQVPSWFRWVFPTSIGLLIIVALLTMTISPFLFQYSSYNHRETANIAFLGNSFTFVNDLPRLMEALSNNNNDDSYYHWKNTGQLPTFIRQDSMLHGGLSFSSLLRKGNGMYKTWHTKAARMVRQPSSIYGDEDDKSPIYLHDYGACTVTQLLTGYDPNLSENNTNEYYTNDGKNPCFQSLYYYDYTQYDRDMPPINEEGWDFVVMNDQSMRPAMYHKRNKSIAALQESYVPLLLETGAIPVLYSTYGYWRSTINMTERLNPYGTDGSPVTDVPTFASRLYRGYELYADALRESGIPEVRIAPVGLAFLTIWEENYSLWERLFLVDEFHPTPLGTYLIGCTIYNTIFGKQPPPSTTSESVDALFEQTRRLQRLGNDVTILPTAQETLYLRYVAKRVTLLGHVPKSLRLYKNNEEENYNVITS